MAKKTLKKKSNSKKARRSTSKTKNISKAKKKRPKKTVGEVPMKTNRKPAARPRPLDRYAQPFAHLGKCPLARPRAVGAVFMGGEPY